MVAATELGCCGVNEPGLSTALDGRTSMSLHGVRIADNTRLNRWLIVNSPGETLV